MCDMCVSIQKKREIERRDISKYFEVREEPGYIRVFASKQTNKRTKQSGN